MQRNVITRRLMIFLLTLCLSLSLAQAKTAPKKTTNNQRFATALKHVQRYYVEKTDQDKNFEHAIRGMLRGLDPHSSYLNEKELIELKNSAQGQFAGVGMHVIQNNGYIKIMSAVPGSPAQKAGLKSGDFILRVNNKSIMNMPLSKAVRLIRGPKHSKLHLTIYRQGENKPRKIQVIRDTVAIDSVDGRLLDHHLAYIRVTIFQLRSGIDLVALVKKLRREANNQLNGLILDLRNNPGGIMDSAIDISDAFLDANKHKSNQKIVYTKARIAQGNRSGIMTPGDVLKGAPLIVLINEGSASASEIVAGALQDHKRAIILGKKSFGKGSVQTILALDQKTAIKLTTARYYTPKGRAIQAKGITPDIEVNEIIIPATKKDEKLLFKRLREVDLNGHLNAEKTITTHTAHNTKQKKVFDTDELMHKDFQLYQALNLLKGMVVGAKLHT